VAEPRSRETGRGRIGSVGRGHPRGVDRARTRGGCVGPGPGAVRTGAWRGCRRHGSSSRIGGAGRPALRPQSDPHEPRGRVARRWAQRRGPHARGRREPTLLRSSVEGQCGLLRPAPVLSGASPAREDRLAAAELDTATRAKAGFAVDLLADALAPTNLLLTNPAALERAFKTGGQSAVAGALNCVDDILHNGGRPRQVDASPFRLGENMAITPSEVVYRNEVMELLQYHLIFKPSRRGQCKPSFSDLCCSWWWSVCRGRAARATATTIGHSEMRGSGRHDNVRSWAASG
jgi:hypothetical protein